MFLFFMFFLYNHKHNRKKGYYMSEKQIVKTLKAISGVLFSLSAIFFFVMCLQTLLQSWANLNAATIIARILILLVEVVTTTALCLFSLSCITSYVREVRFEKAPLYIVGALFVSYFLRYFLLHVFLGRWTNAWSWIYVIITLLDVVLIILVLFTDVLKEKGEFFAYLALVITIITFLINNTDIELINEVFILLAGLVLLVMNRFPLLKQTVLETNENKAEPVEEGKTEETDKKTAKKTKKKTN